MKRFILGSIAGAAFAAVAMGVASVNVGGDSYSQMVADRACVSWENATPRLWIVASGSTDGTTRIPRTANGIEAIAPETGNQVETTLSGHAVNSGTVDPSACTLSLGALNGIINPIRAQVESAIAACYGP